jgi:hypothetical protein
MNNDKFRTTRFWLPVLIAILGFLLITIAYFNPLLEGKRLDQHDIVMWKGMSKEIIDFRKETGEEPLWTNSMFGGMPAWQISVVYGSNLMRYAKKVVQLWLPYPANAVFLYMLGFFVLLLVLRIDPWLSMSGAIAFAFSSYFFIILGAGHTSKAFAIGYMAPVLAGVFLAFKGKYLWGALLASFALALQLEAGHLQITYYLLLVIILSGLVFLAEAVLFKTLPVFFKASGILILGAVIATLTHSTNLYGTYEYGRESMRGAPVLTKNIEGQTKGLERSYITHWSYGIGETWSLLIPNAKGGGTAMIGPNHPALQSADRGMRQALSQQNAYWGDQPGTSGPVYAGAIVVFLFVLGLFFVKGKYKWILLLATILSILLSWGKNFMPFTDFFLDYIPGYAKFRAVSMTLVIADLTLPLLGFLGLYYIYRNPLLIKEKRLYFWLGYGLTGGLALMFYLLPTTFFSFFSKFEIEQFTQIQQENPGDAMQISLFMSQLEAVRVSIFKADALRSFFFVTAAAVVIYLYSITKIKSYWLTAAITVLILFDMVPVAQRYLNNDNFVPKRKFENPFQPTQADKEILNDDAVFRVLDLTKNTFNDASTSYFHQAVGGYHGAKLQRYQDIIDYYLQNEIRAVSAVFNDSPNLRSINAVLAGQQVLNMLNTKYIIFNPATAPLINSHAFGNAWLAQNIKWVQTPDGEIDALRTSDLKTTAVLHDEFRLMLSAFNPQFDSLSSIKQTHYAPNNLKYEFTSEHDQLVIFSEIWTSKGWNLYVDGTKYDLLRANYLLRAALIPAGNYQIEMRYEPKVWIIGERISLASSLLLVILMVGVFAYQLLFRNKAEA